SSRAWASHGPGAPARARVRNGPGRPRPHAATPARPGRRRCTPRIRAFPRASTARSRRRERRTAGPDSRVSSYDLEFGPQIGDTQECVDGLDAQVYRIVAAVVRHHLAVRVTAGNAKGKEVVARRAVDIEAARDHAVAAQRIAKPGHLAVGAVHRQPLLGLEGDAEDGAHHRLVQPAAYVAGHAASRADLLRIG